MSKGQEIKKNAVVKQTVTPMQLLTTAIEKGVDVTQLEKLMELQIRWEKQQAEKSFNHALTRFQRACPKIKKTKKVDYDLKEGGKIKYKYAPLDVIASQIKDALAAAEISYRWEYEDISGRIKCTCIVTHVEGHSKTSSMIAPIDTSGKKNSIQQIASTHTYLQRYTLIGALGLTSAEDDADGAAPYNTAQERTPTPEENEEKKKALQEISGKIDLFTETKEFITNKDSILQLAKEKGVYTKVKEYLQAKYYQVDAEEKKKKLQAGQILGDEKVKLP